MSHLLKKVAEEKLSGMPSIMEMEYFSSANFIGLFVCESVATLLKELTADFAEEIKKAGVCVCVCVHVCVATKYSKSLSVRLAFGGHVAHL